jgi:FkbM family methyltransferase
MMRKVIDTYGYNEVVRGRYGHMIYNKHDIYIGRAVGKYGEFSESEVDLFRQLCTLGDAVIEVGANIGTHTLAFSQMVGRQGRIYAFEPQRIIFQTLCANMALNNIENVESFQLAASDKAGHLFLPDIQYNVEGNFGAIEMNRFKDGVKVPVVALDELLELPNGRPLKLIKIDVEGMEHGVISGAKQMIAKQRPFLYVENDRLAKSAALIELIQSLDYRLYWHLPALYNPHNYAGDAENIYPSVVSVNMLCVPTSVTMNVTGFAEVTGPDDHPMKPK